MSQMMSWMLSACYMMVLLLASPMIAWIAWRTGKYREGYAEKLLGRVPVRKGNRTCVWLHAVSVGEVNLLGVLVAELQKQQPELELVVSTTTKTGCDLARKKYGERHTVFYCPLDFSWAVDAAMRRVRPDLLVLAELELWPNLISGAKRHGAKVAVVNGRLSESSSRGYRRVKWLLRGVLRQIDVIAAQDEATAGRFRSLGASGSNVVVTGSLKYDGAQTDRNNPRTQELRGLVGFAETDVVWLAGSTQAPEEAICLRVFLKARESFPGLRLVLVPRHPERFDEVAAMLAAKGLDWTRRSKLPSASSFPPSVLLIDSVGELGAWWGVADLGFVGGSFGDRGGQNMIEPAAYGVATSFGPNTRNFRDIVAALLRADGARVVEDEAALADFVFGCLEDTEAAAQLGLRASDFVRTQLGATDRTVRLIEPLLGIMSSSESRSAA